VLTLYIQTQLLLTDALERLTSPPPRRGERGLSESVQTALLVVFAIAAVAIIIVAVTTLLNNKAAIIAGS